MRKILKFGIILILALIATCGLNVNIIRGYSFIHQFSANSTAWLIIYAFSVILLRQAITLKNKRLSTLSLFLAILFAILQVIGYSITAYQTLSVLGEYWVLTTLKTVGLIIMYYSIIYVIFQKLTETEFKENLPEFKFFTANKKSLVIVGMIIFICWFPYFLQHFPGITKYDSIMQIEQIEGIRQLTGHHPLIHTLVINITVNLGKFIFGSINAGIAIYTIFQMLIMAFIFSFAIYYMAVKKVSLGFRIGTLIYFAFVPAFPMMSLIILKDTIFSGMMILAVIVFIEMITNTESFFTSKRKIIFSAIILLITILFRNNALYSFALTIPFLLITLKGNRKKVGIFFAGVIIAVFVINIFTTNILKIPKGSEIEMYSVPLQQIARTRVMETENLEQDEKDLIFKFLPIENIEEIYVAWLSDPIKGQVDMEYFSENKGEFFGLWFKLLIKYPGCFVDSFLCNTSGYWYPEECSRISLETGTQESEKLGVKSESICDLKIIEEMESLTTARGIPVIGMLFSTGFTVWLILIMFAYFIYIKNYKSSLIFLPILFYWLTVLLGPLNSEYRYIFYMFTVLPIVSSMTIYKFNNKNKEKGEC